MITIIAAIADNNIIGKDDTLPWSLPDDLRHFKKTTSGFPVIMGRSTYDGLPFRPLPNRLNIVLSRTQGENTENVIFATNIIDAINHARLASDHVFIIGGENVYRQTIGLADRLLITHVRGNYEGNKLFPLIDPNVWKNIRRISENDSFSIIEYLRDH